MHSLTAAFAGLLAFFGLASAPVPFQGYVEGEFVLVAPQTPGPLETVQVNRGQTVHKGDSLFTQDSAIEAAALQEAQAEVDRTQASLDDQLKTKRAPELSALAAQRDQAQAALRLAEITYERDQKQLAAKAISQATLDSDKAAMDQARARLEEAKAALEDGRLSIGRDDAIRAAQAQVAASQATLAQARHKLDQKQAQAPQDAFVFDTLYRPGEYVGAGQAVVSLLPKENLKIRFFVPETSLASFAVGQLVTIHIDGQTQTLPATITYIAPKAEYTPPQLYNRDNRNRMVFMIEATPKEPAASLNGAAQNAGPALRPGQPVDVLVPEPQETS